MKMTAAEFKNLTVDEKKSYIEKNAPNLFQYLTTGFELLDDKELDTLLELKKTQDMAIDYAQKFITELNSFATNGKALLNSALSGDFEQIKVEVGGVFATTILAGINVVTNNLAQGLKNNDGILFNGLLAMGAVTILDSILQFEKTIDQIYPGVSSKILTAAGTSLTLLVASQCPVAAVVLKASGIVGLATSFLACENLEKTVAALKEKTYELNQTKHLERIVDTATDLSALSQTTGISVESLCKFGLNSELLQKLTTELTPTKTDNKELELIKNAAELAEKLPNSREDLSNTITTLKKDLEKLIDDQGLPAPVTKQLKTDLEIKLKEATKTLDQTLLFDKTLLQKVVSAHEACNKILEFTKILGDKTPEKTLAAAAKLVKEQIPSVTPKLLESAKAAPQLAKELGLDKRMEVTIERMEKSSQKTAGVVRGS